MEHPNISIESRISKITEQLANKLIKTIAAITKLAKLATKYATSQPAKLLTGYQLWFWQLTQTVLHVVGLPWCR